VGIKEEYMRGREPMDVLWLDDEFETNYAFSLTPWKRVLDRHNSNGAIRLHTCASLERFKVLVEQRQHKNQRDVAAAPFDLLILDVMLNYEVAKNYGLFGFPDETLIPLEAGAQIAGLIRGGKYDDRQRPPWLRCIKNTPMLLLSASPMAPNWVRQQVEPARMQGVVIVRKDLQLRSDGLAMDPTPEFEESVRRLVGIETA
jgi:hypothetical protein